MTFPCCLGPKYRSSLCESLRCCARIAFLSLSFQKWHWWKSSCLPLFVFFKICLCRICLKNLWLQGKLCWKWASLSKYLTACDSCRLAEMFYSLRRGQSPDRERGKAAFNALNLIVNWQKTPLTPVVYTSPSSASGLVHGQFLSIFLNFREIKLG